MQGAREGRRRADSSTALRTGAYPCGTLLSTPPLCDDQLFAEPRDCKPRRAHAHPLYLAAHVRRVCFARRRAKRRQTETLLLLHTKGGSHALCLPLLGRRRRPGEASDPCRGWYCCWVAGRSQASMSTFGCILPRRPPGLAPPLLTPPSDLAPADASVAMGPSGPQRLA